MLRRTGLTQRLGEENVCLTVEVAVARYRARRGGRAAPRSPSTSPEPP
ncbi:hypothetical protein LY474_25545 [Myxococcus stipitatus]|nr:hypothetical protein [Myxococcus stipitatus]MCE9671179.1 hypothetical protein [Myxococcus stipitatus]